mmetsp:Transcript_87365/g.154905  ORF Transcript_87365/g.154905 Transcript_87365/m.154905 type:complete len:308 (+) Transcript_87365:75-998(+)|eukprot:CAMPEP_0197661898 /NCGR_PEP_ID=MMETSP1338-20131121/51737_1 /TAXON_ID=43686 ORGANISM="Pelagodinium beii, Strain RCC1491" /NCGR_SAMPLE_ID=MMETSP1338 /ASSEMBLY_ACC=CAM_ASM_000754 /LENGTH=307 /DNA_ID=CAMNT_0043239547 /DNA_START=68 /DNA_END=991 /DNA_ORIENTATION=-
MPLTGKEDMLRFNPSPSAFAPVGQVEMQKLYYRTTTGDTFNRTDAPAEAKGENFIDVHGIGQRTGPYLAFQKKRAPLVDRSSCNYTQDYIALPLDDAPITRMMANVFKERTKASKGGSHAKFDGSTRHKEQFKPPSRREALGAKQKSAKPKIGRTHTLPTGDLLEIRSFSHEIYAAPDKSFKARGAKAVPPRPNLFLSERYGGPPKTAYEEQFQAPVYPDSPTNWSTVGSVTPAASTVGSITAPERKKPERAWSAPAGGRDREKKKEDKDLRKKLRPSSAVAKMQAMVCRDDEIWQARRAPYLSPGV